jgi:hypothetical protein
MRLQTYRDESRSRHFDLTGGGGHPWSIDLVAATASCSYWLASPVLSWPGGSISRFARGPAAKLCI